MPTLKRGNFGPYNRFSFLARYFRATLETFKFLEARDIMYALSCSHYEASDLTIVQSFQDVQSDMSKLALIFPLRPAHLETLVPTVIIRSRLFELDLSLSCGSDVAQFEPWLPSFYALGRNLPSLRMLRLSVVDRDLSVVWLESWVRPLQRPLVNSH